MTLKQASISITEICIVCKLFLSFGMPYLFEYIYIVYNAYVLCLCICRVQYNHTKGVH